MENGEENNLFAKCDESLEKKLFLNRDLVKNKFNVAKKLDNFRTYKETSFPLDELQLWERSLAASTFSSTMSNMINVNGNCNPFLR